MKALETTPTLSVRQTQAGAVTHEAKTTARHPCGIYWCSCHRLNSASALRVVEKHSGNVAAQHVLSTRLKLRLAERTSPTLYYCSAGLQEDRSGTSASFPSVERFPSQVEHKEVLLILYGGAPSLYRPLAPWGVYTFSPRRPGSCTFCSFSGFTSSHSMLITRLMNLDMSLFSGSSLRSLNTL
jgi:hypothetical protein